MDTIARARGERWEFRCERLSGGWLWKRRAPGGDLVASSMQAFPTLGEALADAARSGFSYLSREGRS
jgi:hypothetical protein